MLATAHLTRRTGIILFTFSSIYGDVYINIFSIIKLQSKDVACQERRISELIWSCHAPLDTTNQRTGRRSADQRIIQSNEINFNSANLNVNPTQLIRQYCTNLNLWSRGLLLDCNSN